ncbi:MAG TPA: TRAP transporter substrate-binding protein [Burkholderiales bacterium]|jgi:C4-dicarboxylate-binding protein DctP|nr:TRAP transporter substrate-binding protein [Burkholderiales bacterium]
MIRLILAALLFTATTSAFAADPIVIKFSHVVATDTPKGKAAEKFKQLAEKYTSGRVKVELYPNSQLYKDREEMEALQLGAVQMLAPSVSKFGPLGVREFEVFDLPYLFPDAETVDRVADGEIGRALFAKLESRGIKGLAYWDNGFKQFSANRPLREPKDFRGLKMRIQSSKVLEAMMRQLGALPQVMAFSEVYSALQQRVVDGTENPVSNLYTQKMHEVQAYLTISDHGCLVYAVIVNRKFWEVMPGDVRAQLEKAMRETTVYERDIAKKDNEDALALVRVSKKTEVYVLSDAERKRWREALLPVHTKFEQTVGRDNLQAIYHIAAAVEAEKAKKKK